MTTAQEPYLKAAGSDRLAPYYDLMARFGMRESRIKGRVIELAQLAPGSRILDVGCGTGTLVLMAQRRHPGATVTGVDGDPTILSIARRKARRAGIKAQLDEGMAYALPYADASFDAVVSTLTFHHLTPDQQERALNEIRRVLRPGGRLVIADLARPHNRLMRLVERVVTALMRRHGGHALPGHGHDAGSGDHRPAPLAHLEGRVCVRAAVGGRPSHTALEQLLAAQGWRRGAAVERYMSMMGTVALYALARPD
ncbi:MAG TPA: class I SAM-dependent methyltransferase [Dehalococcoidia bacterium]|nr:class I SAM-dependent methyltransferase [Dehalococcoidia bacterium]